MAICGPSLHQGSTESRKTLEQNFFFKSALLILTVSMNTFHSPNLFCCFSRYQAPATIHNTTHNSLACVAGARKGKGEKKSRARAKHAERGRGEAASVLPTHQRNPRIASRARPRFLFSFPLSSACNAD